MDSTGVEMLIELTERLDRKGVTLVLGRVRDDLRLSLRASGAIGTDRVFPTIGAAVRARHD